MGKVTSGTYRMRLAGPSSGSVAGEIHITGSKSESNRLLLLQAFNPGIRIDNLSNSDDSHVMQLALSSEQDTVDIHHAGTAMRFLTAFFATREGKEVILTGSERMKQRPIEVLVSALRDLGADIDYLESQGCPPLKIRGKRLTGSSVALPADISSQYISALLLIAPSLQRGLELTLEGTITSLPYIRMTLRLLERVGIQSEMTGNQIRVFPCVAVPAQTVVVESDWSSASYYYSILALASPGSRIALHAYREDSLQGDSVLQQIFAKLGVRTEFRDGWLLLTREAASEVPHLELDLIQAPDLAQTLAVCCFGLGISCDLTGLHTLKIKETDRLLALETELSKLGASIRVTGASLHLESGDSIREGQSIETYNDHRMAMAFAPLAMRTDLTIEDAGVVSKSYPKFWEDLALLGFRTEKG